MSDDLPVEIDDPSSNNGGGNDIWKWILGAGGVVVAAYLIIWIFNVLVGLAWFVGKYALIALLIYGAYRAIRSMLGGGDSSTTKAVTSDVETDHVLEEMPQEDAATGELSADELSADAIAEDELGDLSGAGVDDDLEKEFAELERQMADE